MPAPKVLDYANVNVRARVTERQTLDMENTTEFKKGVTASSQPMNGSGLKILIVHTRWNLPIVEALVKGTKDKLKAFNVKEENIVTQAVPGSYELPFACSKFMEVSSYDAVIAIGVLIKGSTMHFEYICDAVSHGLMRVQLDKGIPVIFGVLTCLTEHQALHRAGIAPGDDHGHNHGEDWGAAAVEMALLKYRSQ
ncbi:Lumazine synthase (6,7-dimethyl-8-ribityllumazine synthase, also known as DMRL synthase) [Planoprotostelium fungivorum]|uniref:6,7-dimethyl-8-ribityllumazine synthase n=1 Tax=Planoprotostelium fungivorum TaxID=1890364 RepID=A0A2P6N5J7_9EUKA|nr:Lumazine synthase (6,7-dimethyl-8-ribityllumazine synthase, also known as DMRL synthase) [Planoprotostelium fungivorum]